MAKAHDAAGLILQAPDGSILLLRRSRTVNNPGYWNLPGGRIDPGETPLQAAIRETFEEAGIPVLNAAPYDVIVRKKGRKLYHVFLARSSKVIPRINEESDKWVWIQPSKAKRLHLHPGLRKLQFAPLSPPLI
tara:strand:+ start:174 stop:572 length:399 start_codon:yes stop_codon:yes gene_type:complete